MLRQMILVLSRRLIFVRTYVITYFSEREFRNIEIQKISQNLLPSEYLLEREKVWQIRYEQSLKTGASLWNGEIYTLEKMVQWSDEHIILRLGTCEYKDILYRIHTRNQKMKNLVTEPELQYLTVCCIPMTLDKRYVFGVRSNQTAVQEGALGLIGGTLNKDEMEIHCFDDFFTFMRNEIKEETEIDASGIQLELFSLNSFRMKYEFLCTSQLPIHSNEIQKVFKNGEFSKLVALSSTEILDTQLPQTDSFRYVKNYLPNLLAKASN